jgi:hypothetical protein
VPSASVIFGLLALASVLAAGAVSGCTTTQQTAERQRLQFERRDAGHRGIDVKRVDPQVQVVRSSIVRGTGGAAIAVTLRNTGDDPVNDLPLAVGVKTAGGATDYVNDEGRIPYFQAHAPALAPDEETTWVFTSQKPLPAGEPTAKVGVPPAEPLTTASSVPEVDVERVTSTGHNGKDKKSPSQPTVEAEVANHTGMPQYDLAVYAWAEKGGRYVAAGQGSLEDLSTDETATVRLKLVGETSGAQIHVAAPPTIFQ